MMLLFLSLSRSITFTLLDPVARVLFNRQKSIALCNSQSDFVPCSEMQPSKQCWKGQDGVSTPLLQKREWSQRAGGAIPKKHTTFHGENAQGDPKPHNSPTQQEKWDKGAIPNFSRYWTPLTPTHERLTKVSEKASPDKVWLILLYLRRRSWGQGFFEIFPTM